MLVSSISQISRPTFSHVNNHSNRINWVADTGYASLGFGIASGVAAKAKKIKLHKGLAYAAGVFGLLHVGLIEWKKYQYRKLQNSIQK